MSDQDGFADDETQIVHICTLTYMSTVSVSQARATLPELLDRVSAGEEVTITRHGVAVAVLMRPDAVRSRRADRALADAEHLRQLVEQSRAATLADAPSITAERAERLVDEVRTARRAR
ncbi:MAG: type II toxin-antitoxin system Phd/YefM family antitoxin [Ilumatobacteraceae bacterium]